jgi:hypothetical protein
MTATPLRARYRVIDVTEIQPGDILGSGRVRVTSATVDTDGAVDLRLANGRTRRLAAMTTVGIYR